jgi:two-component system, NarL family, sensor histidine kinase DevS
MGHKIWRTYGPDPSGARREDDMGDLRVACESSRLVADKPLDRPPLRDHQRPHNPGINEVQRRVLEDRERIARDLHDVVIQRLFAAGLGLQSALARLTDRKVAAEIERTVDHLDEAIREIRNVIFEVSTRNKIDRGVRAEIMRVLSDARNALGFEPRIQMDGVIEAIPDDVSAHLLPSLREALSNVARHAHASAVQVFIHARDGVVMRVVDNGVGLREQQGSGLGLSNVASRAASLGGSLHLAPNPSGGAALEWRVRT